MKKFIVLFYTLLLTTLASAQQRTLVQELERDVPGKGQIRIERDERLDSLIGKVSEVQSGTKIKAVGYRVQVYAGNNTRASKERANEVDKYLRSRYPDLSVHTEFRNPRWRCTVGDFLYYEEAFETLRKLKKETPYKGIIILRNQEITVPL
ncbi:MAG: SPOR domain-containing protein [Bacteroidaceae bacterium]|nr:SPOR domain-containing protein [Bacteroidaceae bacterium]